MNDAQSRPAVVGQVEPTVRPLPAPDMTLPSIAPDGPDGAHFYRAGTVRAMLDAERQRCAKPVPDEWLVKVRRLVHGFEHVSGIARLWEPDYSSGSERALWSRATEACADVAKLLRDAEGPNAELT